MGRGKKDNTVFRLVEEFADLLHNVNDMMQEEQRIENKHHHEPDEHFAPPDKEDITVYDCFANVGEGMGHDPDDKECQNCEVAKDCKLETTVKRAEMEKEPPKKRTSAVKSEPLVVDLAKAGEILGVPEGATVEMVRESYLLKLKTWHPDHTRTPETTRITQEINAAYELLMKDAIKREADLERDARK